jgi:predicted lysophospholipase L1 biosynthesis ABC-type transport system permease subunit
MSGSRANPHWMEIVGVVGDLHDQALSSPVVPEFYAPMAQTPAIIWPLIQRSLVLVMRGASDGAPAEALSKPLRSLVASVDPTLPVADVDPMEAYLRNSQATARFNTLLLSTLGAIALLLAMIGVYGVVSYFVNQRTQEIAIRMALGATPSEILRYVTTRGLRPLLVGLLLGGALATAAAGVLESQLYRVTRTDPATIGSTGLLLLIVALVATYVPARRAVRVPPSVALTE